MLAKHTEKWGYRGTLLLAFGIVLFGAALEAHAQSSGYQPLTGLPGATEPDQLNLAGYVNALFLISISLGGMLAVIRIAFAGFQYMTSGLISSKEKAREDITGALLGLGILLASFVVLYTINPDLTRLDVLRNASSIESPRETPDSNTTQGIANDGDALQCPEGYKAVVSIVISGGNGVGNKGGYECVPKNTSTASGSVLWTVEAHSNAQINAAESRCTADAGETEFDPIPASEGGGVTIFCIKT